jgi:hypothetical protein
MSLLRNQTALQGVAFILLFVSLPLVVLGGLGDDMWLLVGLAVAAMGFLIPPLAKLVPSDDGDEEDEE